MLSQEVPAREGNYVLVLSHMKKQDVRFKIAHKMLDEMPKQKPKNNQPGSRPNQQTQLTKQNKITTNIKIVKKSKTQWPFRSIFIKERDTSDP